MIGSKLKFLLKILKFLNFSFFFHQEFLKDSPEGTFVLRYTSKRDNYVLSYKEKKGINHSLIEKTPNGYTMGDICLPYVWDLLKQSKFLTFQDSRTYTYIFLISYTHFF